MKKTFLLSLGVLAFFAFLLFQAPYSSAELKKVFVDSVEIVPVQAKSNEKIDVTVQFSWSSDVSAADNPSYTIDLFNEFFQKKVVLSEVIFPGSTVPNGAINLASKPYVLTFSIDAGDEQLISGKNKVVVKAFADNAAGTPELNGFKETYFSVSEQKENKTQVPGLTPILVVLIAFAVLAIIKRN